MWFIREACPGLEGERPRKEAMPLGCTPSRLSSDVMSIEYRGSDAKSLFWYGVSEIPKPSATVDEVSHRSNLFDAQSAIYTTH